MILPTLLLLLVGLAASAFASASGPALGTAPGTAPGPAADDRPNILLFVTDDHRADVLGCAGHPIVRTPSIDRLAAEGVRFENAFVTTSICAASRATILTGLVERTHRSTFGRPPLDADLCARTYPARLRAAGYRTGFVGKLGVALEGGRRTIDALFDEFVPLTRTPYVKTLPDGTTRHETDLAGDAAISFIRATPTDVPFCLSVSFNAAHAEDGDLADHYPPPPTEAGLYADVAMPRPRLDDPAIFAAQPDYLKTSLNRQRYFWRWDTPEKYDRNLRNYFRLLTGLDRNIGRVLDELDARGLAERTIVIVIGDNGYYMGERGFAGKWSHYEESLRVPFVIRDPRVPADRRGRVAEAIALNLDVAPTILAAAGLPPDPRMTGIVADGVLEHRDGPPRDDFYCEHRMRHLDLPRWEGLRTSRYKYAHYLDAPAEAERLHDLRADPQELRNLADDPDHREVLQRLRAETARRSRAFRDAGPPLPRVLLLGDSISMGYHDAVVRTLDDEAVVVRPAENCEGTTKALRRLDAWLQTDGGRFDVIHFNFGLHDLRRQDAEGRSSDDPADRPQAELDAYERNLREIVRVLRGTGATLVFATTTPVPAGGVRPHRDPEDVDRYNDAARRVMAEHGIAIDELGAFAAAALDRLQKPVDVHFTDAGSRELGAEVARVLRGVLHDRIASR